MLGFHFHGLLARIDTYRGHPHSGLHGFRGRTRRGEGSGPRSCARDRQGPAASACGFGLRLRPGGQALGCIQHVPASMQTAMPSTCAERKLPPPTHLTHPLPAPQQPAWQPGLGDLDREVLWTVGMHLQPRDLVALTTTGHAMQETFGAPPSLPTPTPPLPHPFPDHTTTTKKSTSPSACSSPHPTPIPPRPTQPHPN
jgi:hypothetical protein